MWHVALSAGQSTTSVQTEISQLFDGLASKFVQLLFFRDGEPYHMRGSFDKASDNMQIL